MDTEFLVQMRQSNKCGSVTNDEIFNLHLKSGASPWNSIPCLLQDTSHIYWFRPLKQLTRKKAKNPEMRFNSQKFVSYCLGLRTRKPGLRGVDLKPTPKRGSEIRQKDRRRKQVVSYSLDSGNSISMKLQKILRNIKLMLWEPFIFSYMKPI